MILELEIQLIKGSLGKTKNGAELTLGDTARPQCLVPFSYYVGDVATFEEANKLKLADLRYKKVNILCTHMEANQHGGGFKLQGELALAVNHKESK